MAEKKSKTSGSVSAPGFFQMRVIKIDEKQETKPTKNHPKKSMPGTPRIKPDEDHDMAPALRAKGSMISAAAKEQMPVSKAQEKIFFGSCDSVFGWLMIKLMLIIADQSMGKGQDTPRVFQPSMSW